MPKDAPVFIDLAMEDEIVVMHPSDRRVPQQIKSSRVLVARPPERVALQLEEWYTRTGRSMPPPCTVGPRTALDINKWKSGQPVLWSYKGLEEMSVTYYALDGNRYVLVATGPTKGPFIITCIQNSGRNSPPVPYHIWEGWNGAGRGRGFEPKPSISKCVRPPDRERNVTRTTVSCPVRMRKPVEFFARVSNNNARIWLPEQPTVNGQISSPRWGPQPHVSTETAPIVENTTQQLLHSTQAQDFLLPALPTGYLAMPDNGKSPLPLAAQVSNTQDLATRLAHPKSSMLQCDTPDRAISRTLPLSSALIDRQSPAKKLTKTLTSLEQRNIPSIDRRVSPPIPPQPNLGNEKSGLQGEELSFCQRVLTELMDSKHWHLNQPFLQPVNPVALNVPTHFQVIRQPIDLSTIQHKLASGGYEEAEQFAKDMDLMFTNCTTFNRKTDPVYKSGQALNELFVKLWAQRKLRVQDDSHVPQITSNESGLSFLQEARQSIEPFTPPTISAAASTQKYAAEEFRPSPSLRVEADRAQPPMSTMQNHCVPCQGCLSDTILPGPRQEFLPPSESQHLNGLSIQKSSNPFDQVPDNTHERQFTHHDSRTRHTSPGLSEKSCETLLPSSDSNYSLKMQIETELEFQRSKCRDSQAKVTPADSTRESSTLACKRTWDDMSEDTNAGAENVLVNNLLNARTTQKPFQTNPQLALESPEVELSSEGQFINSLRQKGVTRETIYKRHHKLYEKVGSPEALRMRHIRRQASRTKQNSTNSVALSGNVELSSNSPQTRRTSLPPGGIENMGGSSLEPLHEANEPEDRWEASAQNVEDQAWMNSTGTEQSAVQSLKVGHMSRNLPDQHESALASALRVSQERFLNGLSPSESRPKSIAAPSVTEAQESEPEGQPESGSPQPPPQPNVAPQQWSSRHEKVNEGQPNLPTGQGDTDVEMSGEEGSDEEYTDQEKSGEKDSKSDKHQKCAKPQTPSLRQARSKFSKVGGRMRKCENCGKFMSKRSGKNLSSETGLYFCRECDKRRNNHAGQPRPKPITVRPREIPAVDRRCNGCGGDDNNKDPHRPCNPGREGDFFCQACAVYPKDNKAHRNRDADRNIVEEEVRKEAPILEPNREENVHRSATRKTVEEEVGEETHIPEPRRENNVDNLAARSEPLKQEILESQGLVEIPAFSPTTKICPTRLKQHIRDNVMFLFYTPSGRQSRYESFGECGSVYKLFGQAIGAKAFGPRDERLKPEGNVLSIRFGAGQSDVGGDLRVVEGQKKDFEALVDAIEQRDWWKERNGTWIGSGILEVRAVG
jgi:hypothetical protein